MSMVLSVSTWCIVIEISIALVLLSSRNNIYGSYIDDNNNNTGSISRELFDDVTDEEGGIFIAKSLLQYYKKKGRVDVPDRFDGKLYVKKYPDLFTKTPDNEDAWLHWVQFGRYEDRIYFEVPEAIPKSTYESARSGGSSYIHIVFGVDEDTAASTMVSVASIIKFSSARNRLYFHFILVDLSWDNDFFKDSGGSFSRNSKYEMKVWSNVPDIIRSTGKPPATFAVFYAGQLFPSLHRFIYLNPYLYAVKSMDELWNVNLGNCVVAMMDECSNNLLYKQAVNKGIYNVNHPMFKQIFGASRQLCYPDASVLIVNQLLFNELRILDRVMELITLQLNEKKFVFKLEMQSLIVMTNYDHYLPLHVRWNVKRRPVSALKGPAHIINISNDIEQKLWTKVVKMLIEETNVDCKEVAMGSTRSREYVICLLTVYAYKMSSSSVKKLFKLSAAADNQKSVSKKAKQADAVPISSAVAATMNKKARDRGDDSIHVVYAVDESSAALALISVGSIVKQSIEPRRLFFHFILIDLSWDKAFLDIISNSVGGTNARFEAKTWSPIPVVIATMTVRGKSPERYPVASFALIYVGVLFPALDRYIFLDNTIFSVGSIDSLWDVSLDNRAVGMVQQCNDGFRANVIRRKSFNVKHPAVKAVFKSLKVMCYPSEGVILVDQVLLNKLNYVARIEEWIVLNEKEFVFQFGVHQLMVMATWDNNCFPLEDRWNGMMSSRTRSADVSLMHFNAPADHRFMLSTIDRIMLTHKNNQSKDMAHTACQESIDELTEQWCKVAVQVFEQPRFKQLFSKSASSTFLRSAVALEEVPSFSKASSDQPRVKSTSRLKKEQVIHVVYAFDEDSVAMAMVSAWSVINSSIDPSRLSFHFMLVDQYWSNEFLVEVANSLNPLSSFEASTWEPLPSVIRRMKIRGRRKDLSAPANYARFYVSKVFPKLDRFIYLDNDVLAVRSIDELWMVPLGRSNVIAMVNQCDGRFRSHVIKHHFFNTKHPIFRDTFGVKNYSCYPNAGVMLVNQTLYNELNQLQRVEELIKLNQKEFIYELGSQPLVVLTNWNSYLPLEPKWNVRSGVLINEPHLFHYNGKDEKLFMTKVFDRLVSNESSNISCDVITKVSREQAWCAVAIDVYRNCSDEVKSVFDSIDSHDGSL